MTPAQCTDPRCEGHSPMVTVNVGPVTIRTPDRPAVRQLLEGLNR